MTPDGDNRSLCLLPVAVALALLMREASPFPALRRAGWMLLAVSLGNSGLVVAAQARYLPSQSAAVERVLRQLVRDGTTVYVSDRWIAPVRRLREHGLRVVPVLDAGPDPDPQLASRMPCGPLRVFPGTMNEIRYCTESIDTWALGRDRDPG